MKLANNRNKFQFALPTKAIDVIESFDFAKIYINPSCIRDEIKETLRANAKREIRKKTKCGNLPRSIANKTRYFLDVVFNDDGEIKCVKIGCELFINPHYSSAFGISANRYKNYINDYYIENGCRDRNLSLMAGCMSELETEYNDINEMLQMERFLTEVLA